MTASISCAFALSRSKSSPKSFTATSARTPATISFTLISIGCVKTSRMPGKPASFSCMAATSSSWVSARFQRFGSCNVMKMSESSTPIGSVATSAVPVRVQTRSISSGNARRRLRSRREP